MEDRNDLARLETNHQSYQREIDCHEQDEILSQIQQFHIEEETDLQSSRREIACREQDEILSQIQQLHIEEATAPVLLGNHIKLQAENCPNATIAGVVLQKHFHIGARESEDGHSKFARQVSRSLFASLVSHYIRQYSWMTSPGRDVRFATEDIYVGLRMQPLDFSGQFKQDDAQKKKILFEPLPRTHVVPKNVLVRGDAGFGKTTLCRKIAYDWAGQGKTFPWFQKDQSLVLFLEMNKLDEDAMLEDELLKLACQNEELDETDPTVQNVRLAVRSYGKNVIVVLDGYTRICSKLREQIKQLLEARTDSLFREASIVVTSRPDVDKDTLFLFHKNFMLRGFSVTLAQKLAGKYFKQCADVSAILCQNVLLRYQIKHVSPLIVLLLCQCDPGLHKENADGMTRQLVCQMFKVINFKYGLGLSDSQLELKLLRLGSFFWSHLVKTKKKKIMFSQQELLRNLEEDYEFILNLGVLKTVGSRTDSYESLEPVHAILTDMLATFYLEKCWLQCTVNDNVSRFLTTSFPKLPLLHLTCYIGMENQDAVFRLRFDYLHFRLHFEISAKDKICSVLSNPASNGEDEIESGCRISYQILLRKKADYELIVKSLRNLFPNTKSVDCLAQFILSTRFSRIALNVVVNKDPTKHKDFLKTNQPDILASSNLHPLQSLKSLCQELRVTFTKPTCTEFAISTALGYILGTNPELLKFENGVDVIERLSMLELSPSFDAAHAYGSKRLASFNPAASEIVGSDFRELCDRLELFFGTTSNLESLMDGEQLI